MAGFNSDIFNAISGLADPWIEARQKQQGLDFINSGVPAAQNPFAFAVTPAGQGANAPSATGQTADAGGDYFAKLRQIESGGNDSARSPTGAMGRYQFIPSTWAQYGGGGDPRDPNAQEAAVRRLTADNASALAKGLGRAPTDGELYLAHQQGAGGALALLSNPTATPAQLGLGRAVAVNGGDPNAPAAAFVQKWASRFDGAPAAPPTRQLAGMQLAGPIPQQDTVPAAQSSGPVPLDANGNAVVGAQGAVLSPRDWAIQDHRAKLADSNWPESDKGWRRDQLKAWGVDAAPAAPAGAQASPYLADGVDRGGARPGVSYSSLMPYAQGRTQPNAPLPPGVTPDPAAQAQVDAEAAEKARWLQRTAPQRGDGMTIPLAQSGPAIPDDGAPLPPVRPAGLGAPAAAPAQQQAQQQLPQPHQVASVAQHAARAGFDPVQAIGQFFNLPMQVAQNLFGSLFGSAQAAPAQGVVPDGRGGMVPAGNSRVAADGSLLPGGGQAQTGTAQISPQAYQASMLPDAPASSRAAPLQQPYMAPQAPGGAGGGFGGGAPPVAPPQPSAPTVTAFGMSYPLANVMRMFANPSFRPLAAAILEQAGKRQETFSTYKDADGNVWSRSNLTGKTELLQEPNAESYSTAEINGRVIRTNKSTGEVVDVTPQGMPSGYRPMTEQERAAFGVPADQPAYVGPDGKPSSIGGGTTVNVGDSKTYDKQLAEGLGKAHAALANGVEDAQARARDLAAMQGAIDSIQRAGGSTGFGAQEKLTLQKAINAGANALGIAEPYDVSDPEFLTKFNRQIAGAQAKGQMGARVTNFEMANYLKANPGLEMSTTGNQRLIGIQAQIEQRNIAVGNAIREATAQAISTGQKINPLQVQRIITDYDAAHHIQDPMTGQDLTQSYALPEFQKGGAASPSAAPVQPGPVLRYVPGKGFQ